MRYTTLCSLILGHCDSSICVSNFIMIENMNEVDQNPKSKNDKVKKKNNYSFQVTFPNIV